MAIVCASALVSFRMMRTWCAPPASTNVIPDVHMRCAVGIIPFIVRGDSLRNDDQAMAWMPSASPWFLPAVRRSAVHRGRQVPVVCCMDTQDLPGLGMNSFGTLISLNVPLYRVVLV
jgi:hypothetical protein